MPTFSGTDVSRTKVNTRPTFQLEIMVDLGLFFVKMRMFVMLGLMLSRREELKLLEIPGGFYGNPIFTLQLDTCESRYTSVSRISNLYFDTQNMMK